MISISDKAMESTQNTLRSIIDNRRDLISVSDYTSFVLDVRGLESRDYFDVNPDEDLPTPKRILESSDDTFREALHYKPKDTDTVVDFTLQIGVNSTATRAAWRALVPRVRRAPDIDLTGDDSDPERVAPPPAKKK